MKPRALLNTMLASSLTLMLAVPASAAIVTTLSPVVNDELRRPADPLDTTSLTVLDTAPGDDRVLVGNQVHSSVVNNSRAFFAFDITANAAEITAADTVEFSFTIASIANSGSDFELQRLTNNKTTVQAGTGAQPLGDFYAPGNTILDGSSNPIEFRSYTAPTNIVVGQTLVVDVTDQAKLAVNEQIGDTVVGLQFALTLVDSQGSGWDVTGIYRTAATNASDRPELIITKIPEPASMALLAIGGAMLATRRRQRH